MRNCWKVGALESYSADTHQPHFKFCISHNLHAYDVGLGLKNNINIYSIILAMTCTPLSVKTVKTVVI